MLILEHLPYDLLRFVFDHLDTPTLLNACVANKPLNELASWALYSSIIVNPDRKRGYWWYREEHWDTVKNPFKGLQRMPALRNAVRHVTIYPVPHQPDIDTGNTLDDARRCCEELALLPNVYSITLEQSGYLEEVTIYMNMLSKWSTVRIFRYADYGNKSHTPLLPNCNLDHVRKFEMTLGSHTRPEYAESKLAPRITTIESDLSGQHPGAPGQVGSTLHFSKFVGLQELKLNYRYSCDFIWLAGQLSEAHSLRVLKLTCGSFSEQGSGIAIPSTGLRNLKVLKIQISQHNVTLGALEIDKYISAIAGASRLETLSFITTNGRPSETRGDRLLKHVVNTYGSTLQVLKLPNFHPPIKLMGNFFSRCPNLYELWIGVTFTAIVQLPTILYQAKQLQTLSIFVQYNVKGWLFSHSESFLRQASNSLQTIEASGPYTGKRLDTDEWKVLWCYNEDQECAVRRVVGPDKALLWQTRPKPKPPSPRASYVYQPPSPINPPVDEGTGFQTIVDPGWSMEPDTVDWSIDAADWDQVPIDWTTTDISTSYLATPHGWHIPAPAPAPASAPDPAQIEEE